MRARDICSWCWREVISVILMGLLGMGLLELAWLALRLGPMPPRPFLLFAGVLFCALLHPRLVPPRRIARV